jgi:hypothetical protein
MIFIDLFLALLYLLNALISEGHRFANTPAVPSSSPNSEKRCRRAVISDLFV